MWPNQQFSADLVEFTEEILMENFIFFQCHKIVYFAIGGLTEYIS